MEIDINKIKDERLTEDEKMEIIADYLGEKMAPLYLGVSFEDTSDDGGEDEGDIEHIEGRYITFEDLQNAAWQFVPSQYRPMLLIAGVTFSEQDSADAYVPFQFEDTPNSTALELYFTIYCSSTNKEYKYLLTCSASEDEITDTGGHGINAHWKRVA